MLQFHLGSCAGYCFICVVFGRGLVIHCVPESIQSITCPQHPATMRLSSDLLLTVWGRLCLKTSFLCKGWLLIYFYVFILLLPTEQRIHSFLSLFISPDGLNSQKHFPKGLDTIQEELLEVGRRFGSVIQHNRQLFAPYYSGILKKMLLPDSEPDSDTGMDSFWSSSPHTRQGWNSFSYHASASKKSIGQIHRGHHCYWEVTLGMSVSE